MHDVRVPHHASPGHRCYRHVVTRHSAPLHRPLANSSRDPSPHRPRPRLLTFPTPRHSSFDPDSLAYCSSHGTHGRRGLGQVRSIKAVAFHIQKRNRGGSRPHEHGRTNTGRWEMFTRYKVTLSTSCPQRKAKARSRDLVDTQSPYCVR